jgi:hypothetical protein
MAVYVDVKTVAATIGDWLLSNGGILTSAIAGLFGVFADNKTGRKWTLLAIGGVLGGMVWALVSSDYAARQQSNDMKAAIQKVDSYVESQEQQTDSLMTAGFADVKTILEQQLGVRSTVAANATAQQALSLDAAGLEANNAIAAIPEDQRKALMIWVFQDAQQQVDFAVVRKRLAQLAGTIQPDPPRQQTAPTNSVWYGPGATLDEAKAAALIAVSAGLRIRQVCPATVVKQSNLLQLGGSKAAASLALLSPSAIQDMQKPVCVGTD